MLLFVIKNNHVILLYKYNFSTRFFKKKLNISIFRCFRFFGFNSLINTNNILCKAINIINNLFKIYNSFN